MRAKRSFCPMVHSLEERVALALSFANLWASAFPFFSHKHSNSHTPKHVAPHVGPAYHHAPAHPRGASQVQGQPAAQIAATN